MDLVSNSLRTDFGTVILIYEDPNLAQFRALGYIAGFTDSEVSSRSDLYDVYVNLADSEITVSPVVKGWLLFLIWI